VIGDKKAIGKRTNTLKRDFILYIFTLGVGGGGQGVVQTGVDRYTFWVDHNRFATVITKFLCRNQNFKVFSNATQHPDHPLFIPGDVAPMWIDITQSNDKTIEQILSDGKYIEPSTVLPYDLDVEIVTQPKEKDFFTDQGRYVFNSYNDVGFGLGNNEKIVQSFVPKSPILTGIWLKRLYRSGNLNDVNRYHNIVVEVWDKNKNIISTMIINKKAGQLKRQDYKKEFFFTISGVNYWIDLDEVRVRPSGIVRLEEGLTHYICVKQDKPTNDNDYFVGSNSNNGIYNERGHYIYGEASTAPYNLTTLTPIGPNLDICFKTERNVGRMAVTFYWGNNSFWWYNPVDHKDQFKFVKEDFDEVI